MRNSVEIASELAALKTLLPCIIANSPHGSDKSTLLRTQIRILEKNMTPEQITDKFEDGDQDVLCAALDVMNWLQCEKSWPLGLPASEMWTAMLEDREERQFHEMPSIAGSPA